MSASSSSEFRGVGVLGVAGDCGVGAHEPAAEADVVDPLNSFAWLVALALKAFA
jgi:hypothetical protein